MLTLGYLNIVLLWEAYMDCHSIPAHPSHLRPLHLHPDYHYLHQTNTDHLVICSHGDLCVPSSSIFQHFIINAYLRFFFTNPGVRGKKLSNVSSLPLCPENLAQGLAQNWCSIKICSRSKWSTFWLQEIGKGWDKCPLPLRRKPWNTVTLTPIWIHGDLQTL